MAPEEARVAIGSDAIGTAEAVYYGRCDSGMTRTPTHTEKP